MRYRRVRRSLKHKRDTTAIAQARGEIKELRQQHADGKIDLRFLDEAGFSLQPVVPYAWQCRGSTIELPANGGERVSVIGLLSDDNRFESYVFDGYITSELVIASLDAFVATISLPTVIILDNGPMHTAKAVQSKRAEWEAKGLRLQFLPTYAPELNIIEILWKHIKYYWLGFDAYDSLPKLKRSLCSLLKQVGSKYRISFA
jgi:transposase